MSSISHFPRMRVIRPAIKAYPRFGTQPSPLHPTLYSFQGNRQSKRCFHIGPTIATALQGTQDLILSFHHATHTPWFITIPLVALGVNLLFRLPFNIYTQKIQQRRAKLAPILQAWNTRIQRDIALEGVPPSQREAEVKTRFGRTTARIWKKFGLQDWKLYANTLGIPFWLVGIDAIRRLCGGPTGILGHLFLGSGQANTTAAAAAVTEGRAIEKGADDVAMPSSMGTSENPAGLVPAVEPSSGSDIADTIVHAAADPSLTTGGVLWFPDLTVADPWHVLPLALSAILVANVWPKTAAGRQAVFNMAGGPTESNTRLDLGMRGRLGLHRGLFVVSLLVGPLTMNLPAALHLYWISSSTLSWATQKMLARMYPVGGNSIQPCKGIELPVIRPKRDEAQAKKDIKEMPLEMSNNSAKVR